MIMAAAAATDNAESCAVTGMPPVHLHRRQVSLTGRLALCHGDWTDANLLAVNGKITAVLHWKAARAHRGPEPLAFH